MFKKGNIPWNKGIPTSEEIRRKISETSKGRIFSKEHRRKIGEANKKRIWSEESKEKLSKSLTGKISWNRGLKGSIPWNRGIPHSKETRAKMSKAGRNKILSEEHKKNISKSNKGSKNGNWKGGITELFFKIHNSFKYRQWRSDVFTRDNFTCQNCGQIGGKLNVHHIKPYSKIIQFYEITTIEQALECEEIWNINNGITLCGECHKVIHRKRGQKICLRK